MYKQKELSQGLRLTLSDDEGVFLHFKTKDGNGSGICLNQHETFNPGLKWAEEQLEDVIDEDS